MSCLNSSIVVTRCTAAPLLSLCQMVLLVKMEKGQSLCVFKSVGYIVTVVFGNMCQIFHGKRQFIRVPILF